MSDEVRKAAERLAMSQMYVRDCEHIWSAHRQCQWCHSMQRDVDVGIVASDYLAEHPADDDEPVTEEWLLSVGFELSREGLPFHVEMEGYLRPTPGDVLKPGKTAWDWKMCPPGGSLVAVLFTRGDIRRLCRVLDIELKEQSCG